jgi:hypothetical protein
MGAHLLLALAIVAAVLGCFYFAHGHKAGTQAHGHKAGTQAHGHKAGTQAHKAGTQASGRDASKQASGRDASTQASGLGLSAVNERKASTQASTQASGVQYANTFTWTDATGMWTSEPPGTTTCGASEYPQYCIVPRSAAPAVCAILPNCAGYLVPGSGSPWEAWAGQNTPDASGDLVQLVTTPLTPGESGDPGGAFYARDVADQPLSPAGAYVLSPGDPVAGYSASPATGWPAAGSLAPLESAVSSCTNSASCAGVLVADPASPFAAAHPGMALLVGSGTFDAADKSGGAGAFLYVKPSHYLSSGLAGYSRIAAAARWPSAVAGQYECADTLVPGFCVLPSADAPAACTADVKCRGVAVPDPSSAWAATFVGAAQLTAAPLVASTSGGPGAAYFYKQEGAASYKATPTPSLWFAPGAYTCPADTLLDGACYVGADAGVAVCDADPACSGFIAPSPASSVAWSYPLTVVAGSEAPDDPGTQGGNGTVYYSKTRPPFDAAYAETSSSLYWMFGRYYFALPGDYSCPAGYTSAVQGACVLEAPEAAVACYYDPLCSGYLSGNLQNNAAIAASGLNAPALLYAAPPQYQPSSYIGNPSTNYAKTGAF